MLMEEAMAVSIPQSGLQAFRLGVSPPGTWVFGLFQSLNRAYKRSDSRFPVAIVELVYRFNPSIGLTSVPTPNSCGQHSGFFWVSIPQSGLQAFRHDEERGS